MVSAGDIRCGAPDIQKPSITSLEAGDIRIIARRARGDENNLATKNGHDTHQIGSTILYADSELELIGRGSYNNIWRVESTTSAYKAFILRLPREDALHPWQLENEASWLKYMTINHPSIPVPALLDFSTESSNRYLAEEFIDAAPLSDIWSTYSEDDKLKVARSISKLIVDMAEIRFDQIGGLKIDGTPGPTVEGMKWFKGRNKFHSSACYNIGPYSSLQEYILACYDKEIYYYSHAGPDIDQDLFEDTSVDAFIQELRTTRETISRQAAALCPEEPFVLAHGDFHGRNTMMKGTTIAAVLDWEFAGSFPLSETLSTGGSFEVLEMRLDMEEADVEECYNWSHRIDDMVIEEAKSRGWADAHVELLASGGKDAIGLARMEMIPCFPEVCLDSAEHRGLSYYASSWCRCM